MTDNYEGIVMALRGEARMKLVEGWDEGKVAYDIVRDIRREGLFGAKAARAADEIIATLRGEGYFKVPEEPYGSSVRYAAWEGGSDACS